MNILWIPHTPRKRGFKHRHEHLIENLKDRHNIHIVEWDTFGDTPTGITNIVGSLNYSHRYLNGNHYHHLARFYDIHRRMSREKSKASSVNEVLFQNQIRHILRRFEIDVMVGGPSAYLTGFPPFDTGIPFIFDYLDCADWSVDNDWKKADIIYIKSSAAVVAVSHLGCKQAKMYSDNVYYVPNGVDVIRFQNASGEAVIEKFRLGDKKVISLIGITCSPSLYFIDAVGELGRERSDVRCLIVGESSIMPHLRKRVRKYGKTFVLTGPILYGEIPGYFAATDVGLYPQDNLLYYHAANPIKVFEYAASGKWVVVSPQLDEITHLGFHNVVFSEPNVESLKNAIGGCLDRESPAVPANISDYDWQKLAGKLENILYTIIGK